jgi:3-hydroxyisobutyrate dehydrogenase
MGRPMAARLVGAGYAVAVRDAAPGRAAAFVAAHGGREAASGEALAATADCIITMLPSSREVAAVLAGLRPALKPGTLVIDMSSGEPAMTRTLAEGLAPAGIAMIDAPVSGGVARAETGTLSIMTGGEEAALARAEPLLRTLGGSITRCGGVGAGQAMKALNNLVSAAGFLISIEALLIGARFGLDPETMVEALNAGTGMNNSTQRKLNQFVLSRKFNSGFGLDLMVKDLGIALRLSEHTATPALLAAHTRALWAAAAALLGPGQDHTAIARLPETLAATELHPRA